MAPLALLIGFLQRLDRLRHMPMGFGVFLFGGSACSTQSMT
jgi:hypothetical protein